MRLLKNLFLVTWITFVVPHSDGFVYPNHLIVKDETQFWINLVLKNLVEEHLTGCSVILIGNASDSSTENMIKIMFDQSFPHTLINLEQINSLLNASQDNIIETTLYAPPPSKCLVVISDVTMDTTLQNALSVFETFKLQHWPEIRTIFFGPESRKANIFSDYFLRNTKSLIFFSPKEEGQFEEMKNWPSDVSVYGRCFYCNLGNEKIIILDSLKRENQFQVSQNIFPEMPSDFQGHEFKLVGLSWYPTVSIRRLSSEPCSEAVLVDSLDARIMIEMSKHLNFKYKIHIPCDNKWGHRDDNGNWSGIMGDLYRHKADFSFILYLYPSRLSAMDFSRIYTREPMYFIARKPQPLPRSMALIRPLEAETWFAMLASIFVASILLWILFRLSPFISAKKNKTLLVDSFFLTLSIILLEPPVRLPRFDTGRIFIACWWLYCMIISISYRSSLIAHLNFPTKSTPVYYISELVEKKNEWSWGYEPMYGAGWEWFKGSSNPDVQIIFNNLEILELDEQMDRVLQGKFAFFTFYYYIKAITESHYKNKFGFTPVYFSREINFNYGGVWGYRKGAPFRLKIDRLKHLMIEGGLIDYWMNDLIYLKGQEIRKKREREQEDVGGKNSSLNQYETGSGSSDVLGLDHMQGAFYFYIVGSMLATVCFLIEILNERFRKSF